MAKFLFGRPVGCSGDELCECDFGLPEKILPVDAPYVKQGNQITIALTPAPYCVNGDHLYLHPQRGLPARVEVYRRVGVDAE